MRIETMKKPDSYGSVLILVVLLLFGLMLGTLYKLNQQSDKITYTAPPAKKQYGFMVDPSQRNQHITILSSKKTAEFYMQNGSSVEEYSQKIRKFSEFINEIGYKTTILPIEKLSTLDKDAIAFVVDAQVISGKNKKLIQDFVRNGGALFFNFLAGFTDEKGAYLAEKFVKSITNLALSEKGFASFPDGLSITPKILSPFSKHLKEGKLLNVAIYDELPIYHHKKGQVADVYATSYDQVRPPLARDPKNTFKNAEAGVVWHGYAGEGKWVYTSLPSYSFYDIDKERDDYKKLLSGMISFYHKKYWYNLTPISIKNL